MKCCNVLHMSAGSRCFHLSADLQDIAALVGDEQDIELLKRLIDKSDIASLDCCMLRIDWNEFGKGRE